MVTIHYNMCLKYCISHYEKRFFSLKSWSSEARWLKMVDTELSRFSMFRSRKDYFISHRLPINVGARTATVYAQPRTHPIA